MSIQSDVSHLPDRSSALRTQALEKRHTAQQLSPDNPPKCLGPASAQIRARFQYGNYFEISNRLQPSLPAKALIQAAMDNRSRRSPGAGIAARKLSRFPL
jgi:hypothetical protein